MNNIFPQKDVSKGHPGDATHQVPLCVEHLTAYHDGVFREFGQRRLVKLLESRSFRVRGEGGAVTLSYCEYPYQMLFKDYCIQLVFLLNTRRSDIEERDHCCDTGRVESCQG